MQFFQIFRLLLCIFETFSGKAKTMICTDQTIVLFARTLSNISKNDDENLMSDLLNYNIGLLTYFEEAFEAKGFGCPEINVAIMKFLSKTCENIQLIIVYAFA